MGCRSREGSPDRLTTSGATCLIHLSYVERDRLATLATSKNGTVGIALPIGHCPATEAPYSRDTDYSDRFAGVPECEKLLDCVFNVVCPDNGYDEETCSDSNTPVWCRPDENDPGDYTPEVLARECSNQYADKLFDVCRRASDPGPDAPVIAADACGSKDEP